MASRVQNQPKIRGFVATAKNVILLLYRKSSKVTFLFLLDYQNGKDRLEAGSRFYGRIYPERCDISPDGSWFIYFAMGKSQKQYAKKLYCWTGICKPPNIKANLLFAHGDTWGGGGRFVDEKTIYISPGLHPEFNINHKMNFEQYQITFEGKFRDGGWAPGEGWELMENQILQEYGEKYPFPKLWSKSNGKMTLLRSLNHPVITKGKHLNSPGIYDIFSYELLDEKTGQRYSLNDYEKICVWADYDNLGRLIVAREDEILIYKNFRDILEKKVVSAFKLDDLIL